VKTRIVFIFIVFLYGSNSFAIKLDSSLITELPVFGMDVVAPDGSAMVVPSNATAVALNVTAVTPSSSGFITVWPCGVARPATSNVNYTANGIVPNGVIAPIGSGGKVCFYSMSETDLIVDVAGWFAGDAFVGITPSRLADTRTGTGVTLGRVGPDAPLVIQVSELNVSLPSGTAITVPANITTAALNVTIVNPISAGFVTVYPCDRDRPLASNVNYAADQVVANGVIAPVSESGTVCVYSPVLTDVVVDLAGWLAGSAFTGSIPTRLVDTRDGTGGLEGKLTPANELSVSVRGVSLSVLGASQQVPDDATAVALNVTAVTPDGSGFITVYPCGVTRPLASSLNYIAGDIVANNVMAPIGDDGAVCLYTSSPSDVLVDISGWFQGVTNNEFVGTTPKRLVDTRDSTGPTPVSSIDSDGDGVLDVNDAFPLITLGGLTDTDGDGRPDVCDAACQGEGMTADTELDFSRNWDLRRVSPDAVNTDQASVDAILNLIFTDQAIQSVLISKNGFTIGERYADGYDKDSYGTSWSVAKSFYSAAIGVAIDEGLIASVDINVSDIITEWQNTDKADITLKQVLQMRSGYASGTEVFFAADQTLHAINFPLESTPDSLFRYSNANTQLLSPILARTTSQTAHQYLVNKILAPIGIDTTSVGLWFDSTATNPMTYCCLDMRPDDFARFGLLYARNGNWQGEQIVSSDYVSQSMLATSAPYGFQWWILNDTYYGGSQPPIDITAALGLHGQKIYVWPQKDIVIVVLTKYIHAMNQGYVLDLRPDVLNFPDTCTGRNTCSGSQGPAVANYNEFRLIRLIQALDND